MNRLGPNIVQLLSLVAQEMSDATETDGYLVGAAVDTHPSFSRSNWPRGSLRRALVASAAQRGASQAGLYAVPASNDSIDIRHMEGLTERRFRLKHVIVGADGEYVAVCSPESSLLRVESSVLGPVEKWILGYTTTELDTVEEIFVAQVLGHDGKKPGRLTLGRAIPLRVPGGPRGGFVSTDEGLNGFDDQSDEGAADGLS